MKKWCLGFVVLAIMLPVISCGPSAPPLTETQKSLAIETIKDYPRVRDAAVVQDGSDLTLAIIVDYATSEEYAKELGDNFVRLVKTFSEDESPHKRIGKGIYNYLVGVYYPNEELVVMGAKSSTSDHITW